MKRSKAVSRAKKLSALLLALCLMFSMVITASAASTNSSVQDDKSGVVRIELVYTDPDTQAETWIQSGSGFLINENTIVTCNHVINMDSDTLARAQELFEKEPAVILNNCRICVYYLRDVTPIEATVEFASDEMDYAVLNMSAPLTDRTYLPLRSSETVEDTEDVYVLGFPYEVSYFEDKSTYTSNDVTVTSGKVSKLTTMDTLDVIQISAPFTNGTSGGPLVDEDGCVIGICRYTTGTNGEADYYYAVGIDQLIDALEVRGVTYTKCDHSTSTPVETGTTEETEETEGTEQTEETEETEQQVDKSSLNALYNEALDYDTSEYTEESADNLTTALTAAGTVLTDDDATQGEVDNAYENLSNAIGNLETKSGLSTEMLILIIVAAVVVIALIIIIIVLVTRRNRKKKEEDGYSYGSPTDIPTDGSGPVINHVDYTSPSNTADETTLLNQGAGETTVLNQGAGETTVLNQKLGSLTRKNTSEEIPINSDKFVIGKERNKTNYCVSDNSAVSRTHATIVNRGGNAYLVDMRATNGTFLNGVRMNPGQESLLKDGDTILLADEEFTYHTN